MGDLIYRKVTALCALLAFLLTSGIAPGAYSYAQDLMQISQQGAWVGLSPADAPPLLKGVKVFLRNPFRLDFIIDKGNSSGSADQLKVESTRLIKYFLASITVPEKDLWVNLSPYEKNRIVPDAFGLTEMGRDLLTQDYMLKQITTSVIYPEGEVGKVFWGKVYAELEKRFGTIDVPVDTFNKVWIVPEKAVVYESNDSAYVVESKFKVMLESDYVAMSSQMDIAKPFVVLNEAKRSEGSQHDAVKEIFRQVIIPILEKEVNEGKNFAQLRQIYHALILAIWFKDKIKDSILGKAYIDQDKVAGVDVEDRATKNKIWAQYVDFFKRGAFNYIKEDFDPATQQTVPRKYFSGGAMLFQTRSVLLKSHDRSQLPKGVSNQAMIVGSYFKTFHEDHGASVHDMAMNEDKEAFRLKKDILGIIEDVRKIHPRTAVILSERLDLRSPDDLDALKYLKEDAQWFKDNPAVSGTYDGTHQEITATEKNPKVSFIILHYGSTPGSTLRLLNALARQTYKNFDIVLVDNNSPDKFSDNYKRYGQMLHPDILDKKIKVELVSNKVNLGFTAGNNQAAHVAMRLGSKFLFMINNDAVLDPSALENMVAKFNSREDVGAMQPLVVPLEEGLVENLRDSGVVPDILEIERIKVQEDLINGRSFNIGKMDAKDGHLFHRVPALVGVAMMVRTEAFRLSGGFDSRLFMYKDEDDASYLLRKTGFAQVITTDAAIFHARFDYVNKPRNQYSLWKNAFLLAEKFFERSEADPDWKVFEYNSPYRVVGSYPGGGLIKGTVFTRVRQIIDVHEGLDKEMIFLNIYKGMYDGIMGAFKPTREDMKIDENVFIEKYVERIYQMKTTDEILRFLIDEKDPFFSRLKIFALEKARKNLVGLVFMDPEKREIFLNDLEVIFHQWESWVKSREHEQEALLAIRYKLDKTVDDLLSDHSMMADGVGGIDLTHEQKNFQVQSSGSGIQLEFEPDMIQQLQNASGLMPVIIDIRPMTIPIPKFLDHSSNDKKLEVFSM